MPYKDPVIRAAYHREYNRRNRHRYREQHKIYDAAKHANERAALHGAPGVITVDEVSTILASGHCYYCGTSDRLSLDHVVPLHLGGLNRPENIVCCCVPCNISKWRSDRPGRWSQTHEQCTDCGGVTLRHASAGRCISCYSRVRKAMVRAGEVTPVPRAPAPPHGTRRRYEWRYDPCRCDECRAANTERRRRQRGTA